MSLKATPHIVLLLAALVFAPLLSRADTIMLNTGEKIIGTIKSETDTQVTIDITLSSSITDERVLQKSDIAHIDREQPDQIAYRQLSQLQPNPDYSFTSQAYSQILSSLQDFITKYPNSAFVPDIQKQAETFQAEKSKVDAGQVKFSSRWLTAAQAQQPEMKAQLAALGEYDAMKQQAAAGNLVEAMQAFDIIEKQYPGTRYYVQAAELAQEVMPRLQADLTVRMQEVKADQEQLKKTIDFTAEPEKTAIINAAKSEQDRADAIVAGAQKAGQKWVPLIPRSEKSITALQSTATAEVTRIGALPVAAMAQSIAKCDAAMDDLARGDHKDADDLLKEASTLWSQNLALTSLNGESKLEAATPTPTPKPTPTPHPLPTAAQHPVIAAATPAPEEEEAARPFFLTIPGAIAIAAAVLVIGGIVASVSQKRARKQATAE